MSKIISNEVIPSGNRYYTIKEYEFNGKTVPVFFFAIRNVRSLYGNKIASILQSNSGMDLMKVKDPMYGEKNKYSNVIWARPNLTPDKDGYQLLHLDTYACVEHSEEDIVFDDINPINPLNVTFTAITFHNSKELEKGGIKDTLHVNIPISFCSLGLVGRFEYVNLEEEMDKYVPPAKYNLFSMIKDDNAMKNTLSFASFEFK